MKNDMHTLIFGKRSNLSFQLSKGIENAILISSHDYSHAINIISQSRVKRVNIVLNQFQPATMINDSSNFPAYIERAILSTAKICDALKNHTRKINKILYTSSSSVYGDNEACKEEDVPMPLSLHASLKLANEKLLTSFCEENALDFIIARVFNMYGGDDKFSIISKLISSSNSTPLGLINNGAAIRDFIHVNDVVHSYKELFKSNQTGIFNIASGQAISIKTILEFLQSSGFDIQTFNVNRNEISISAADKKKICGVLGSHQFISVKDYILYKLKK